MTNLLDWYICPARWPKKVFVSKRHFKGGRKKIREQSVVAALDLVRRSILEEFG
jgi:nicotinamide mononucleotide (NMN) deamidase PncC